MTALLHPVRSSALTQLGYDEPSRTLYVVFKNGAAWCYRDVPPDTYIALRDARSIGSWFMRNVRNTFAAERIGDQAALMAMIEASVALKAALAHAEREARRRFEELQQSMAGLIRRGDRTFVAF